MKHLGDQIRLHLDLGPHKRITFKDRGHEAGGQLTIRPENPLWFDASGMHVG